jgi:hypothetical protein
VPARGGARAPVRVAARGVIRTSSRAAPVRAKARAATHKPAAPAKKKRR